MKLRTWLGIWLVLAVGAQVLPRLLSRAAAEDRAPTLRYVMDARLAPKTRQVEGRATLTWSNPSDTQAVDAMWLHLYLNAFRDERSTFMQERSDGHRGNRFDKGRPGSIELLSFRRTDSFEGAGGADLIAGATYEAPDDGNADDRTVLKVPLAAPLQPGEVATFEMTWTSTLPRVFARTGAALGNTFFMVAQWYPKPGVFEPVDGDASDGVSGGTSGGASGGGSWAWNCHQFHGNSEFFADYGTYDVTLRVPQTFEGRVGATGEQQGAPARSDDGTLAYRFVAQRVHDFAWVCGRDFEVRTFTFEGGAGTDPKEQARVAAVLGVDRSDLDLPSVQVTMLLQPEHLDQADRHQRAVEHALTLMGFWYGPYPYPTLTVVDPDHRARGAGGMEYPTLIMGGTGVHAPARRLSPEGVLVHEFGHQHFYGLVGSNEFESPWLDEGFTTFATGEVLMHAYPPSLRSHRVFGLPLYGERPLGFEGLVPASRQALESLSEQVDDWSLPFGELGPIASAARHLGVNHPPARLSLWPKAAEISPLAFLREVPPLSHVQQRPTTTAEHERLRDAETPIVDPIAGRAAWQYMNGRSYGVNSYRRTANALRTLRGLVGGDTMLRIVRTYATRFRFKHPKPRDFFDVAQEIATRDGKGDIRWFFTEIFEQGRGIDFGIESIETRKMPVIEATEEPAAGAPKPEPIWRSDVTLRRFGEARVPVPVVLRFEDGTTRTFSWERDDTVRALDGGPPPARTTPPRGEQAKWVRLRFHGTKQVNVAHVDPHRLLGLERNRLNDGRRREAHPGAARNLALKALAWVEMTTTFYGGL